MIDNINNNPLNTGSNTVNVDSNAGCSENIADKAYHLSSNILSKCQAYAASMMTDPNETQSMEKKVMDFVLELGKVNQALNGYQTR